MSLKVAADCDSERTNVLEKLTVETMLMRAVLFIVPLFVFVGCASAPPAKTEAVSHARPVVIALRAFHQKFGDYPQALDELRPQYLAADIPIYDNSDPRHIWILDYQRVDRNHYTIDVDSGPCSQAVFKDGIFIAGYGPNFNKTQPKPATQPAMNQFE